MAFLFPASDRCELSSRWGFRIQTAGGEGRPDPAADHYRPERREDRRPEKGGFSSEGIPELTRDKAPDRAPRTERDACVHRLGAPEVPVPERPAKDVHGEGVMEAEARRVQNLRSGEPDRVVGERGSQPPTHHCGGETREEQPLHRETFDPAMGEGEEDDFAHDPERPEPSNPGRPVPVFEQERVKKV